MIHKLSAIIFMSPYLKKEFKVVNSFLKILSFSLRMLVHGELIKSKLRCSTIARCTT